LKGKPLPKSFFHKTPDDLLQSLMQQEVKVEAHTFRLTLPTSIDALLDHPSTQVAFDQDEYLPYWATLWPSAQLLAQALAQQHQQTPWPAQTPVLELGCGLGLVGITALALGLHTIFSDYDEAALAFAAQNAHNNGFEDFTCVPIDWRYPPENLRVPLILAADVLYESRHIAPLVNCIQTLLLPAGECWLVDPNRPYGKLFQATLSQNNLTFSMQELTLAQTDAPMLHAQLYRITSNLA
jgi:predicted nicotinamide N-methyase